LQPFSLLIYLVITKLNKMKKYHIILFTLFFSANLFSQDFQWVNSAPSNGDGNPNHHSTCIITDLDDNLIFTGLQISKQGAYGDVFLHKINADGVLLREVILEGEGKPPSKMSVDENNNLYFYLKYTADMTWDGDTIKANNSQTNLALIKLDDEFNLLWVQYQDKPLSDFTNNPICLEDGLIYSSFKKSWDTTLIRVMDTDGIVLEEIIQENTGHISSIDVDTGGNIYVTGSCTDENAVFNGEAWPPPPFSYNIYLVKYNHTGTVAWVKYIEDVTCVYAEVVVSATDHIYLSGILTGEKDFDNIHLDGPSWVYDFFVARLNGAGDFLWVREVPDVLSGDASVATADLADFRFMDSDADHNVYLTGMIRGTIDWGNGIVTGSTDTYYDMLTWSYDADGEMRYAVSAGGEWWDWGHSLTIGNGGEIYLSGIATQQVTFGDIVIEEEGLFSYVARFNYDPTGIEQAAFTDEFHIYPNPATDEISIETEKEMSISVVDMTGRRVLQKDFTSSETKKLDISTLDPGIYICLISGTGFSHSVKVMKK
jgi:hypothetical protein